MTRGLLAFVLFALACSSGGGGGSSGGGGGRGGGGSGGGSNTGGTGAGHGGGGSTIDTADFYVGVWDTINGTASVSGCDVPSGQTSLGAGDVVVEVTKSSTSAVKLVPTFRDTSCTLLGSVTLGHIDANDGQSCDFGFGPLAIDSARLSTTDSATGEAYLYASGSNYCTLTFTAAVEKTN